MPSRSAVLLEPPGRLAARVCDCEDGLSLDELIAKSTNIVEQRATGWRDGACQEVSRLRQVVSGIEHDSHGLHSTMQLLSSSFRVLEDQASILELEGVRKAASQITAYLARADAERGEFGAPQHHIASITTLLSQLEAEIGRCMDGVASGS